MSAPPSLPPSLNQCSLSYPDYWGPMSQNNVTATIVKVSRTGATNGGLGNLPIDMTVARWTWKKSQINAWQPSGQGTTLVTGLTFLVGGHLGLGAQKTLGDGNPTPIHLKNQKKTQKNKTKSDIFNRKIILTFMFIFTYLSFLLFMFPYLSLPAVHYLIPVKGRKKYILNEWK